MTVCCAEVSPSSLEFNVKLSVVWTVYEQTCIAALDRNDKELAMVSDVNIGFGVRGLCRLCDCSVVSVRCSPSFLRVHV